MIYTNEQLSAQDACPVTLRVLSLSKTRNLFCLGEKPYNLYQQVPHPLAINEFNITGD